MLRIGLTGGIGSGKTAVSDLFAQLGIPIIDTDVIARQLVENDADVLQKISNTFGQDVLELNGQLNRKKLAKIVFNVKADKQRLEDILHPKIQAVVLEQLQQLTNSQTPPDYTVVVVPLLIETRFANITDRILLVMADEENRIKRVQQRDNRTRDEIRAIISQQASDEVRLKKADDIIENNSLLKSLKPQVSALHDKYTGLCP